MQIESENKSEANCPLEGAYICGNANVTLFGVMKTLDTEDD